MAENKVYIDDNGMIHPDYSVMTKPENKPDEITDKDLTKAYTRWWWANEVPHTFDRMLAPAFLYGMMPILKKLYKDDDMLVEAYQRHLMFFNTECNWGGSTITGMVTSMEEARANALHEGKEGSETDASIIQNTKVGLMGPLAGIGDSIENGTIQYIFIALFLPLVEEGNGLGAFLPFVLFSTVTYLYGRQFTKMGYKLGRKAALEILSGSRIQTIINALGVMGLFMMGVMAASYVKISSSLAFTISGKEFIIQDLLDGILPGFLPLLAVILLYQYFEKKGMKVVQGMVYLTIILAVLAGVGIL